MSILLPNGVTVVFESKYTTALSDPSTRPYYILPSSGSYLRRYDYLPDKYLDNLQVNDSTCALVCLEGDIELVESTR